MNEIIKMRGVIFILALLLLLIPFSFACKFDSECPSGYCNIVTRKCVQIPICSPGSKRCSGNSIEICKSDGSGWSADQTCPNGCANGACSTCSPGSKKCDDNFLEVCGSDGNWMTDRICPYTCLNNACVNCSPGSNESQTCLTSDGYRGTQTRVCSTDGTWNSFDPCILSCVVPYDNMTITNDTIFCQGVYNLNWGIDINRGGIILDCNGATLLGNHSMYCNNGSCWTINGIGVSSDYDTIKNCIINNYIDGIYSWNTGGGSFINNTIINNGVGIDFDNAGGYKIIGNNLSYNGAGIYLYWGSDYNIIENNSLENNNNSGITVSWGPSRNTIKNNIVKGSGIGFNSACPYPDHPAGPNNYTDNLAINNTYGFYDCNSDSNIFKYNTAKQNSYGFYITGSNNTFYYNNLLNNSVQAVDNSLDNKWNNGTRGNYWSNYDEAAEGCVDSNSNGFCDTPYNVSNHSQDNYPFIGQITNASDQQVIFGDWEYYCSDLSARKHFNYYEANCSSGGCQQVTSTYINDSLVKNCAYGCNAGKCYYEGPVIEDFEDISDWDNEWHHLEYYSQSTDRVFGNYSMKLSASAKEGSWAGKVETPLLNQYWDPSKNWSNYPGIILWMKRGTSGYGSPLCDPRIRFTVINNGSNTMTYDTIAYYTAISNTSWQRFFFPFNLNASKVQKIIIDLDSCGGTNSPYDLYMDQMMLANSSPPQICTSDSMRCNSNSNNSEQCSSDGSEWIVNQTCSSYGCNNGVCLECTPSTNRCNGNNLEACNIDGSGWAVNQTCYFGCSNNVCLDCYPNSKQCNGNNVEKCRSDGSGWAVNQTCSDTCLNGNCIQALRLSAINISMLSDAYAVVSWETNNQSDSKISYGETISYSQFIYNATDTINHSIVLSPLLPDSVYHFKIKSCNGASCNESSDLSFRTFNVTNYSLSGCLIGTLGDYNDNGLELSDLDKFESSSTGIAKHAAIVLTYKWWTSGWMNDANGDGGDDFPLSDANLINNHGSITHITWEPRYTKSTGAAYYLDDIISGKWDVYIHNYAIGAKNFNKTIYMRFMQQMNDNEYDWSGYKNGYKNLNGFGNSTKYDGPERFVAVWKHVVDIFRQENATNVQWVWALKAGGADLGINISEYYPGDDYIDWLGVNGFNYGTPWKSFDDIYLKTYSDLKAINSSKPIMIGDFASSESGGNKSAWMEDAFTKIKTKYSSIKAFNWFNKNSNEGNFLVDSSTASKVAFQQAMNDSYYVAFPYSSNASDIQISAISVSKISDSYAIVNWRTSSQGDSKIYYGITGYSYSISQTDSSTDHPITLYQLVANTTYHFKVKSCYNNTCGESADQSFKTFPMTDYPLTGCYIGAYVDYIENDGSTIKQSDLDKFESSATGINKHAAVISVFKRWTSSWMTDTNGDGGDDFPISDANLVANNGSAIHIAWEAWYTKSANAQYNLDDIISGKWDTYIHNYATAAKAYGQTVYIRFGHEADGPWYPWGGPQNGGSSTTGFGDPNKYDGPERYVAAWKHVVDIFRQENATNVQWVWAPYIFSDQTGASNISNYYPGDDYVDWLGIQRFDYGNPWKSLDDLFFNDYALLKSINSSKPIMFAELGAGESGGNKSAWINDTFAKIKERYPSVKIFTWFNINKEANFLVDSSPESKAAFQKALNDSYYVSDLQNLQGYHIGHVTEGNISQYKLYFGAHHFLTVVDDNVTFNLRPHPGVDVNGWGSSWYMQPFISGATLNYTQIKSITAYQDKIEVKASGNVSKGANERYGAWIVDINLSYNNVSKEIEGNGSYEINLSGNLSSVNQDLNLYKIASNYLYQVPLLTGGIGDTGDMSYANVTGFTNHNLNFIWNPPVQPGHFPQDKTDLLSIDVKGQYNNVNTSAQGYAPIQPAYKPSLKVILTSRQTGIPMIFGGIYDMTLNKTFWADNIAITPLILKSSASTQYSFDVYFKSTALAGDGS